LNRFSPAGKRIAMYFAWDRSAETDAPLGENVIEA
jgi:hypothetical protein